MIFVVAAVVALGGFLVYKYVPLSTAPATQPASQQTTPQQPPAVPAPVATAPDNKTVTYTDAGYAPATLTIKKGETVTFQNNSSRPMWTASAMHPTHSVYPTTGGCIGSTFDACRNIPPGGSWSFQFDIVGSWKYHDHLNPTFYGGIEVSE